MYIFEEDNNKHNSTLELAIFMSTVIKNSTVDLGIGILHVDFKGSSPFYVVNAVNGGSTVTK